MLVGGTFAKTSERYNFFLNNSDFHQNLFPQSDDGEGTFRDKEIAKIIAGGDIALQNRWGYIAESKYGGWGSRTGANAAYWDTDAPQF